MVYSEPQGQALLASPKRGATNRSLEVWLPHKKSTIKRRRHDEKLNARNRAIKSRVSTAIRKVREASPEERDAAVREAVSTMDKAVKAGVMRKETASRKKARLMRAKQDSQ